MAKETLRKCPGCGEMKSFRRDQKTCGCKGNVPVNKPVKALPPEPTETNKMTENTWEISIPKTPIHTLEQLIEHCKVDLEIWEVERFIVNKWEVAMTPAAWTEVMKTSAGTDWPAWQREIERIAPLHENLFQVKAFLRKKALPLDHYAEQNAILTRQLAKARLDLNAQRAYNQHLAKGHAGYDDLLAHVSEFVDKLGVITIPRSDVVAPNLYPTSAVREGHTEDVVALWSDTHFSDVIRHEDTSGFPEFDLPISGNRWGYVIKKEKQILSIHRAFYPIKTLYIWFGGDMGNGDLHGAGASNALFMPAQVHFTYHMLANAIEDMLTLTQRDPNTGVCVVEKIVLLFTVGNHMRMDIDGYMPTKYQAQRTFDWLIYQFLIERFKNTKNVEIRQEMSPFIFENIRGHRYLFAHGYQVGYKNNPDVQAKSMGNFIQLVRALFDSPEFRKKNGLEGETFARACIGDIHVPVEFPRLISNGSLNGQNELGVNWTLEPIPAGQQLFGVSEKHIQTWKYFVDCSHIQREQEDFNPYGMFAAEYDKKFGRS